MKKLLEELEAIYKQLQITGVLNEKKLESVLRKIDKIKQDVENLD